MSDRKALIIEDSPDLAVLACRQMVKLGFAAQAAHTGHEALKWLATECPDVILMDLSLPDLQPDELVQAIRSIDHCKAVPLILVSGNSELQAWGNRLGTSFTVTKPFDRMALSRILEKALPGSSQPG